MATVTGINGRRFFSNATREYIGDCRNVRNPLDALGRGSFMERDGVRVPLSIVVPPVKSSKNKRVFCHVRGLLSLEILHELRWGVVS